MKNACIVGYGSIGPIHAEAIKNTDGVNLYAVCDTDKTKIEKCREKYNVKGYNDFDKMLADTDITSVHICTPHHLHFDMIEKAVKAGKEVVAEKPVTRTKEEFELLKKMPGSEKVCLVFQNRYNPCVIKLKELMETGRFGKVLAVKGIMAWSRGKEYYESAAWRGKAATEGGGVLINQAVHTLDLMIYLAGKISSVKATAANYSLDNVIEVEDTVSAYMKFENGAKGILFATNAYGINNAPEIEIVFENKVVRYSDGKLMLDGIVAEEDAKPREGKSYWGCGHEALIKRYYNKNEYFSVSDGENTMNALFAIYESARENGTEKFI